MSVPSVNKQDILNACKYIDEHGTPEINKSTKYDLVTDDGKKYPPKYVIAIANYLANGAVISTDNYNAVEAKNFLQRMGFVIEDKQEKYVLTITADDVVSTDDRFTMDNLALGDNYKPLDVYFKKADDTIIRRKYNKGEDRSSNQTMPRLACQIFEKELASLSVEDRTDFPVCKYAPSKFLYKGIFTSVENFKAYRNTIEYMKYTYDSDRMFVIYCWNIFSTIVFTQECLKRFGDAGDQIVLTYREKDEKEIKPPKGSDTNTIPPNPVFKEYLNPFSPKLIESKNIIFRGAPGTGKSYLAKEIAADIISNGYVTDFTLLTPEQKKQVEFVQFHPSYDYSDFVEGLRPKVNDDGSMGFELQDGIFKKFVARARKNYEDSQKSKEIIENEVSVSQAIENFFSSIELGSTEFKTISGNEFYILKAVSQLIVDKLVILQN